MKTRILFIIMALLLTIMGGARAAGNTFTIYVSDGETLTDNEYVALQVLANREQVITIESGHVIHNGIELFYFNSNHLCTVPPTTTSANDFTHTLSAQTLALLPSLYPSLAGYTSIKLVFYDPEAYVVYSRKEGTLTFCYDTRREDWQDWADPTISIYNLNDGFNEPEWADPSSHTAIVSVKFNSSFAYARPTSCYKWFYDSGITSITGLNYLNTSEVTNMSHMFDGCYSLTKLNVSSFNTAKVTDMSYMFEDCSSLTSLDVSNFNTSLVTDMENMFFGCRSLTSLDVSNFNTANVTSMQQMFYNCSSLTSLEVSDFNTTQVTNMENMFSRCSSLTSLDLSGFHTRNNLKTGFMLSSMTSLQTLSVSNGLINLLSWAACDKIGTDGNGNVTTPCKLIYPATSHVEYTEITDSYIKWKEGYFVTDNIQPYAKIEGGTKLIFCYDDDYGRSKANGTAYDLNTGTYDPGWFSSRENITSVEFNSVFAYARPTTCYNWFMGMKNITSITGLEYLNTSNVTIMENMFAYCSGLTNLDLSNFNTAKVNNMVGMFYNCSGLTNLNVSSFNTANVTNMRYMFSGCSALTSLDVSHFNTARVTEMATMFSNCSNLTSLDVSNFNTTNATIMYNMFGGCSGLTRLDLSGFAITSSTITTALLQGLTSLQTLIVSNSLVNYLNDDACQGIGSTTNPCKLFYPIDANPTFTEGTATYVVWKNGYFTCEEKPYANLVGTTLTFYCDGLRGTRSGTTYNLNTGQNDTEWENAGINTNVTQVVFDSSFANALPTTTYSWFNGMTNLQSITGMEYLNTSEVTNMYWMFGRCVALKSIDVSHFNTANVTTMSCMFYGCSDLTSLDLSSFNTAKVTDMKSMFYQCSDLTTIYAGDDWNTDAVTSANSTGMFEGCTSLVGGKGTRYNSYSVNKEYAHIDGGSDDPGYFTSWLMPYAVYTDENTTLTFYYDYKRKSRTGTTYSLNTGYNDPDWYNDDSYESVTHVVFDSSFADARPKTTCSWFCSMENLQSITGMEYLNTSEVTNMYWMFSSCSSLTSLDLGHFNTDKVTIMAAMFVNCTGLTALDLSSFSTANVTDMSDMFAGCSGLTSLDLSSFDVSNVSNMGQFLYSCAGLKDLSLSATLVGKMPSGACSGVGTTTSPCLLFCPDGTELVKEATGDGWYLWRGGYFTEGTLEPYAVLNGNTLKFYYDKKKTVREGTKYEVTWEEYNYPSWANNGEGNEAITTVDFDESFANYDGMTNATYMFYNLRNLTSISHLDRLNTSNVTNMFGMFWNCESLENLNVSGFNTSNVTNMSYMFYGCQTLTSLNVSNFDTKNVTNMSSMFSWCKNLTNLDLSNFNTAKVTDMREMFYNSEALVTLNLSGFNTINVTDMGGMFSNCVGLTSLDLSSFDTGNVTDMSKMFNTCTNLAEVDLSSFNTENVTDMSWMFRQCDQLTTLDLSGFDTKNVTNMVSMFWGSNNLKAIYCADDWRQGKVSNSEDMFKGCLSLKGAVEYDAENANDISFANPNDGYFTGREAYACWNQDDVTLTFYYDFNKSKREGKVFEIGNNDWSPYVVYTVRVDQSMAEYHGLTSMQGMFSSLYDVTEIEGIEYLNTENVTDMSNMFCDCNSLTSVNLSHFNTSKVTTMAYMFDSCESLTTLNVSGFDMSNVMDVEAMFRYCSNLTTIYCNDNWAKQGLSDAEMFLGCVNLEGAVHFLEGNDYSDWANPTYGYFTWKKLRGDVNGDNKVDVADVTAMVNLIKSSAFSSAADLDGSGTLTAIDMTELVNIILGK